MLLIQVLLTSIAELNLCGSHEAKSCFIMLRDFQFNIQDQRFIQITAQLAAIFVLKE